ncbi:hypothetical protein TRVA0_037S01156 [Trichomonascus vanleenenianus]|uniref:uncharacterized protein n=1 Tax=Trichomonascus vanleenenianus TaxID=2268995 RepID=UPI003ECAD921
MNPAFERLPTEILCLISDHLEGDTAGFISTCRRFHSIAASSLYQSVKVHLTRARPQKHDGALWWSDVEALYNSTDDLVDPCLAAITELSLQVDTSASFNASLHLKETKRRKLAAYILLRAIPYKCVRLRRLEICVTANRHCTAIVSEMLATLSDSVKVRLVMMVDGFTKAPNDRYVFPSHPRIKLVIPVPKTLCYKLPNNFEHVSLDCCGNADECALTVLFKRSTSLKSVCVTAYDLLLTSLLWLPPSVTELFVSGQCTFKSPLSTIPTSLRRRPVEGVTSLHIPCCAQRLLRSRTFPQLERLNITDTSDAADGILHLIESSPKLREIKMHQSFLPKFFRMHPAINDDLTLLVYGATEEIQLSRSMYMAKVAQFIIVADCMGQVPLLAKRLDEMDDYYFGEVILSSPEVEYDVILHSIRSKNVKFMHGMDLIKYMGLSRFEQIIGKVDEYS